MPAKVISIDTARRRKSGDDFAISQEEFDRLYAIFSARFAPGNAVADYWVREAVSASLMRRRLVELEKRILNRRLREIDKRDLEPQMRGALAFRQALEEGDLQLIYEQMEQADRRFHAAHRKLLRLAKRPA